MGADRELKRTRCPACNTRHFWTRPDRKELQKKVKKCSEKPESSSEKRSVRRITQSEAEAIIDLKKAGLSIKEIASALDLTPVQVRNWLYNHKKAVK